MQVLVIEPDRWARKAFTRMLQRSGARVNESASIRAAAEQFASYIFDAIVCQATAADAQDCHKVLDQLRVNWSSGVVLVSGGFIQSDQQDVSATGSVALLPKPCTYQELMMAVGSVAVK